MLVFRSEAHVEKWCKDWRMPRGAVLDLNTCWRLAEAWYGEDRRNPEWRRRTADEAKTLFTSLGLTSAFWNLQG
jgi:hypothetical protein